MKNGNACLRRGILFSMFCVGFFSILAQVLALREFLVVFAGNELTIGAIFGFWLIGVGFGSLAAFMFLASAGSSRARTAMILLLCYLAFLLPIQIAAIRLLRFMLGTPFGEEIPLGNLLFGTACVLLPGCIAIGAVFPCACQIAAAEHKHAVNRVYALDALGGMVGGAAFSFWLVRFISAPAAALIAGSVALAGAARLVRAKSLRRLLTAACVCGLIAGLYPPFTAGMELACAQARWRSFGYLTSNDGRGGALLYSADSRYQNLALIEDAQQKTLYGNGRVMFVFPDIPSAEHRIHFIMAQNPTARNLLLIGGCPATDIPQLLKYPIDRLVHLEPDSKISRIMELFAGPAFVSALRDPRLDERAADGPWFVKTCREQFDAIIIMVPLPTTIAFNRYFTAEFFADASNILAPGGFLYTAIEASEHLAPETANLAASVHKALLAAFEHVLFTAGEQIQFFAGTGEAGLTLDRETLFQRSSTVKLRNEYFRPLYFLDAQEINPARINFVASRLSGLPIPANSLSKPVSTFYSLLLWSRFSGSLLRPFLDRLNKVRAGPASGLCLLAGAAALAIGILTRIIMNNARPARATSVVRGWTRLMLWISTAATGCCELALQIILIFIFQGLFGYVYERIGLISALFMMGLALGALSATRMTGQNQAWRCLCGLELLILLVAVNVPVLMSLHARAAGFAGMEIIFYVLFVFAGWMGGAHFALVNHLLGAIGSKTGSIVSITNAADLFGSALGGFAVGILLLPVLGLVGASMLLAAIKGGSLLCVGSAFVMRATRLNQSAVARQISSE